MSISRPGKDERLARPGAGHLVQGGRGDGSADRHPLEHTRRDIRDPLSGEVTGPA